MDPHAVVDLTTAVSADPLRFAAAINGVIRTSLDDIRTCDLEAALNLILKEQSNERVTHEESARDPRWYSHRLTAPITIVNPDHKGRHMPADKMSSVGAKEDILLEEAPKNPHKLIHHGNLCLGTNVLPNLEAGRLAYRADRVQNPAQVDVTDYLFHGQNCEEMYLDLLMPAVKHCDGRLKHLKHAKAGTLVKAAQVIEWVHDRVSFLNLIACVGFQPFTLRLEKLFLPTLQDDRYTHISVRYFDGEY